MAATQSDKPDPHDRTIFEIVEVCWCPRCGTPNTAKTPITYDVDTNLWTCEHCGLVIPAEVRERRR